MFDPSRDLISGITVSPFNILSTDFDTFLWIPTVFLFLISTTTGKVGSCFRSRIVFCVFLGDCWFQRAACDGVFRAGVFIFEMFGLH